MSGQNSDKDRERQFGNLVKISVHVLGYDACQTKHQQHLTLLLTHPLKLHQTALKVAYSENSNALHKLLTCKKNTQDKIP